MRLFCWESLLPLACAVALNAAAQSMESLAWRQPILGGTVSGRVYRVAIPPEVFDGCKSFPADIRIADEHRVVWPFFLWWPQRTDEIRPIFATMGRRTGGANGQIVVQAVGIRADGRAVSPVHNQVSILTGGHDFIRRVEVLGSEDGTSWKELGSGYLVDQMQESHVSNRLVTYADSTQPHLLLRIHPNARNEKDPIEVLDVQVENHVRSGDPLQDLLLQPLPLPASELHDGVLTLAFDTGAQNRPIEQLRVRTGAGEFTLPAKVFGRNSPADAWRWVADGGLYSVGGQSHHTIDLHGEAFRQLKIDLYHYDQKPPAIESVTAEVLPHFIVLEARGGSSPMLHYGAERMPLPHYDLQRLTSPAAITNAPLLQLGKARSNPLKIASGLSAYVKTMAWVAAAVIGCIFIAIILRVARARM